MDCFLQYEKNQNKGEKSFMTKKSIGYPFQYGDELTPEMASNNRKQAVSYSVLIPSIWWHNLGFGEPIQSYSSCLNESKTPIVQIVETSRVNSINRGGDLGKSGPGPQAKADALKNARKTGGGSIFVHGFTPQRQYGSRPINAQPLSCRNNVKINQDQFNGNGGGCGNNPKPPKSSAEYKRGPFKETENERIFRENSINPQTKVQDQKSVDEARAILSAKKQGLVTDISRPENSKVNLDFQAKGLGPYKGVTHVDIKTPISLEALQLEGKTVSGPNTYSEIGRSMGRKLIQQKARFCNIEGGPESPENVLHIIDLRKLPYYQNKSEVVQATLNAAENAGNTTENIHFINFD